MPDRVILMDVEAQNDLFQPGGALYRPSHRQAAGNLYRLFGWAKATGIRVMSTVLSLRATTAGPLGPVPHCVDGTKGEMKLPRTLLPSHRNLGLAHNTDVPRDLFSEVQQVILEKRDTDIFHHGRAERIITELPHDTQFVVCGGGLVQGIKQAVIGLRVRGFPVIVIEDAVLDLGHPLAEMAWLQMLAKSAQPMSTEQFLKEAEAARPSKRRARRRQNHSASVGR